MVLKRSFPFLPTLLFSLSLSGVAATYNPFTDFSLASNPNGVWSYGYGPVGIGAITLYTQQREKSWSYNNLPFIGVATGAYDTVNVPSTDLVMHPGDAEDLASILVFTAPVSGVYSFAGLFERDNIYDGSGTGVQVSICQDTTNCDLYSGYISSSHYLNSASFNVSQALTVGETLDFEVARTRGSYNFDTTGLQLGIVSPTPEPSSLVLLGTGIAVLVGAVRKRLQS